MVAGPAPAKRIPSRDEPPTSGHRSTPFAAGGSVTYDKLVGHSRALFEEGATGLAILGTASEANSLTLGERRRVIDAHAGRACSPKRRSRR